jgi:aspartyl-tRNA(Asn)/glutamyl-tRNA(Gln) amidotransferase subunit A
MQTITEAAAALADGRTTAAALVEECLARIADPSGEGRATFTKVHAESARASAAAIDGLRRAGRAPGPYAGIPVSLKDLLDIEGEPTPAGSRALADAPPATRHAPLVRRLVAAGFIPVGRTNMTEFAFSGLGINPHYGTPRGPWDRRADGGGHIPGGSSSGAAVSIADGMALAAIGTDTGGSCRIPAACCGVVGYKPTARRVPLEGVVPLSSTLDSAGPLANSAADCAIVDAVIAGELDPAPPGPREVAGLRLAVPTNFVLDGMDATVTAAFERVLGRLDAKGALVEHREFAVLDEIPKANATGGFSIAESFAWHRALLESKGDLYDPRVRYRIERGRGMSAADYITLMADRARLIRAMQAETAPYDAIIMPTIPLAPPLIADLQEEDAFFRTNQLLLRNPSVANFLDRCCISLPCHAPGEAPVGLTLMGETMGDRGLFAIAAAVEKVIRLT